MKLENYEMHLPSYSIGSDVYGQIKEICSPFGTKVLIISGVKSYEASASKLLRAMEESGFTLIGQEYFGGECTYANVEQLRALAVYKEADMVFAVGGGKCLDTCKCLCIEDKKPIFHISHHCLKLCGMYFCVYYVSGGWNFFKSLTFS